MPHDPQPSPTDGPTDRRAGEDPIVPRLLEAYARGLFPMADADGSVYLYDPDPRGVILLDRPANGGGLRVSRSLGQRVRNAGFLITTDVAFPEVIRACAEPRPAPAGVADAVEGTWIDGRIVAMYEALHRAGHAHSIEAWLVDPAAEAGPAPRQGVLVGGLYGVHLGGLFAGESMFSRPDIGGTDASKVCLVHLWHHLRARGFTLLDTQFTTPHLKRLGAVEISRAEYHRRLRRALSVETNWLPFSPTPAAT